MSGEAAKTSDDRVEPSSPVRIRWQGDIVAIQVRAWVWRYKTDNRTHYHLGFNLWIEGEMACQPRSFIVAISDTQHRKLHFRIGDMVKGAGWPTGDAKREIADLYRAGALKVLSRPNPEPPLTLPPFIGEPPGIEVFKCPGTIAQDGSGTATSGSTGGSTFSTTTWQSDKASDLALASPGNDSAMIALPQFGCGNYRRPPSIG